MLKYKSHPVVKQRLEILDDLENRGNAGFQDIVPTYNYIVYSSSLFLCLSKNYRNKTEYPVH